MKAEKQRGVYSEELILGGAREAFRTGPGPADRLLPRPASPPRTCIDLQTLSQLCQTQLSRIAVLRSQRRAEAGSVTEIEPKVMEAYETESGRVPRAVELRRRRLVYRSFDLALAVREAALLCEWAAAPQTTWLPLCCLDDQSLDDYSCEEWAEKAQGGRAALVTTVQLTSLGLQVGRGTVRGWNSSTREFQVSTQSGEKSLQRLQICFDAEDPRKFLARLCRAAALCKHKIVKLKLAYMVSQMPREGLKPDRRMVRHIINAALAHPLLTGVSADALEDELFQYYAAVTNAMLFDVYAPNYERLFGLGDVVRLLVERRRRREILWPHKARGVRAPSNNVGAAVDALEWQPHANLSEVLKDLHFSSPFVKEEALLALQEVRQLCAQARQQQLFKLEAGALMHPDEFRAAQETALVQAVAQLRNGWVQSLVEAVRTRFAGVGRGWYNMHETNKLTYELGKLKRVLTVVRLLAQDTLRAILANSLRALVAFFGADEGSDGQGRAVLLLEVAQKTGRAEFGMVVGADRVVADVLALFRRAVQECQQLPDVEPRVLETLQLNRKGECYLRAPILRLSADSRHSTEESAWLLQLYTQFEHFLGRSAAAADAFLRDFRRFESSLQIQPAEVVQGFRQRLEADPDSLPQAEAEMERWRAKEAELQASLPPRTQVLPFEIDCYEALRAAMSKYSALRQGLTDTLIAALREQTTRVGRQFEELERQLAQLPQTIEEVARLREFAEKELPAEVERLRGDTARTAVMQETLLRHRVRLSTEELTRQWRLLGEPMRVGHSVVDQQARWVQICETLCAELEEEQSRFRKEVLLLERAVEAFCSRHVAEDHAQIFAEAKQLREKMREMEAGAALLNHREQLMRLEVSDHSSLAACVRAFEPYFQFWRNLNFWAEHRDLWLDAPFESVDAAQMEQFCTECLRQLTVCLGRFREAAGGQGAALGALMRAAERLCRDVESFRTQIPLLAALKQEGLRSRHYDELHLRTGINPAALAQPTLRGHLASGLLAHLDVVREVSEKAVRELLVERKLAAMEAVWAGTELEIRPGELNGVFTIANFSALTSLLDQHLSETQTLLLSPYRSPFVTRIERWFAQLLHIATTIEEWQKMQEQLAHLQPIFAASDAGKQLLQETAIFRRVDTAWRQVLGQANAQRNVLAFCVGDDHLSRFRDANESLERIRRELGAYLETKRQRFPRLFFLSDDELLLMLAQAHDIEALQLFLPKLFSGAANFVLSAGRRIIGVSSAAGEVLRFGQHSVDPQRRPLEDWLAELSDEMQSAVGDAMQVALREWRSNSPLQALMSHPVQCTTAAMQLHWTFEVEQAVQQQQLAELLAVVEERLQRLTACASEAMGSVKARKLALLIAACVQNRDVVLRLMDVGAESTSVFEWICQLRYAWQNEKHLPSETAAPANAMRRASEAQVDVQSDGHCFVHCLHTAFAYGYEYIAPSSLFVVTPLTEKCRISLANAWRHNVGGVAVGPAAVGKTETVRNMAGAIGRHCYFIGCHETGEPSLWVRFFKGLAETGTWCCLEYINHLSTEAVSVVAQSIRELFQSRTAGLRVSGGENAAVHRGSECGIFATLNPQEGQEWRGNLHDLFRPTAMLQPDFEIITTVKLQALCFREAKSLARKLIAVLRVLDEQLPQKSYRYNNTLLISAVIESMQKNKEDSTNTSSHMSLLRALQAAIIPTLGEEAMPVFKGIVRDVFGIEELPFPKSDEWTSMAQAACVERGLQPTVEFLCRMKELDVLLSSRRAVIVLGPAGSGKSSLLAALQTLHTNRGKGRQKPGVLMHIINPKAISSAQLYGQRQDVQWQRGAIEAAFAEAALQPAADFWLVFDGPFASTWADSLNTLLDEPSKLFLVSGKSLELTSRMRLLFEVDELNCSSLAAISRCGLVSFSAPLLSWEAAMEAAVVSVARTASWPQSVALKFKYIAMPMLEELWGMTSLSHSSEALMVQSFARSVQVIISEEADTLVARDGVEEGELLTRLPNLALFAALCSFTGMNDGSQRMIFKAAIEKIIGGDPRMNLRGDCFAQRWVARQNAWMPWTFMSGVCSSDSFPDCVIVPTPELVRVSALGSLLLRQGRAVLIAGRNGCGKTTAVRYLLSGLADTLTPTRVGLGAATPVHLLQMQLLASLSRRRRRVIGPAPSTRLAIFIDDVGLPQADGDGARPPLEWLRQVVEGGALPSTQPHYELLQVEDVVWLAATPTTDEGTGLPPRLLRHFHQIGHEALEGERLGSLFLAVVGRAWSRVAPEAQAELPTVAAATAEFYKQIRIALPPIVDSSHCAFTTHDLARVWAGLTNVSPEFLLTSTDVRELWLHECCRVFAGRFATEKDFQATMQIASECLPSHIQPESEAEQRIFVDVLSPDASLQPAEMWEVQQRLEEAQEEHNAEVPNEERLSLLIFPEAAEQIVCITRSLRSASGGCLLLGPAGVGKRSTTQLAAFLARRRFTAISIESHYTVEEWRADLKRFILATFNAPQCLYIAEDHSLSDEILCDVATVLDGRIPHTIIITDEEKAQVQDVRRADNKGKASAPLSQGTIEELLTRNARIVLAMSMRGEELRRCLNKFPTLGRNFIIHWRRPWSLTSLQNIAHTQLAEVEEETNQSGCVELVPFFCCAHQAAAHLMEREGGEIPSASFFIMLRAFNRVMRKDLAAQWAQSELVDGAIEQLGAADAAIDELRLQMKMKEEQLAVEREELAGGKLRLEGLQADFAVYNSEVKAQEARTTAAQTEAERLSSAIEAENASQSAEAERVRERAYGINAANINEVRQQEKPNERLRCILLATCLLLLEPAAYGIKSQWSDEETEQHFARLARTELMKEPTAFLQRLRSLALTSIDGARLRRIREMVIDHPRRYKLWSEVETESAPAAGIALYHIINAALAHQESIETSHTLQNPHASALEALTSDRSLLEQKVMDGRGAEEALNTQLQLIEEKNAQVSGLMSDIQVFCEKIERARNLVAMLRAGQEEWVNASAGLHEAIARTPMRSAAVSALLTYSGPMNTSARKEFSMALAEAMDQLTESDSLWAPVISEEQHRHWLLCGLTADHRAAENGAIMLEEERCAYLIDPQRQGSAFFLRFGREREEGVEAVAATSPQLGKVLLQCLQMGKWLLVESCTSLLPRVLLPLLRRQFIRRGNTTLVVIGDTPVVISDRFRLTLASSEPVSVLGMKLSSRLAVVDWTTTMESLEEQLIATIIAHENRQLEEQHVEFLTRSIADRRTILNLEVEVLSTFSRPLSQLFEETGVIEQLTRSRNSAADINRRLEEDKETEQRMHGLREAYRALAQRLALLYSSVSTFSALSPLYSFSLEWFQRLFLTSTERGAVSESADKVSLHFARQLLAKVSRALLSQHKPLASFLLAAALSMAEGKCESAEMEVMKGVRPVEQLPECPADFLSREDWPHIYEHLIALDRLPRFKGLLPIFRHNPEIFRAFYIAGDLNSTALPHSVSDAPISRLLLLKALRPDQTLVGIQQFAKSVFGDAASNEPLSIDRLWAESQCDTPLLIMVTPGVSPRAAIEELAVEKEIQEFLCVSLTQGDNPTERAEAAIASAGRLGNWVLLEQCHCCPTWLRTLESIVAALSSTLHKDFRLWVTTEATPLFPVSITLKSVRAVFEPASGLQQNMLDIFTAQEDKAFNLQSDIFKKVFYVLAFFHSIVRERGKFAPIGWSQSYNFSAADLSRMQEEVVRVQGIRPLPLKTLIYHCVQLNYGEHISTAEDLRMLRSLAHAYLRPDMLREKQRLASGGPYLSPPVGNLQDYLARAAELPADTPAETLGLHENAQIFINRRSAKAFEERVRRTFNPMKMNRNMATDFLAVVRRIAADLPPLIKELSDSPNEQHADLGPLELMMHREAALMNTLLLRIARDLAEVTSALEGGADASSNSQKVAMAMMAEDVPMHWVSLSQSCTEKSLKGWLTDVHRKASFISQWVNNGLPDAICLGDLLSPQSFLSAVLHTFARNAQSSVEDLQLRLQPEGGDSGDMQLTGVRVKGVYIEGAVWNASSRCLAEPRTFDLYTELPCLEIGVMSTEGAISKAIYECPLYTNMNRRNATRQDGLASTLLGYIDLPVSDTNDDVWLRRGTAAFTSSPY